MRVTQTILILIVEAFTLSCSTTPNQTRGEPADRNALDAQSQRAMTLEIQSVRKELETTKAALADEKAAHIKATARFEQCYWRFRTVLKQFWHAMYANLKSNFEK